MEFRLEHANVCVRDIEAMIRFLQTAFPESRVRGEGKSNDGTRWVHVGGNDTYIALGEAKADSNRHWIPYSGKPGVNHLAYEVDDVESLRARLKAAGYRITISLPPEVEESVKSQANREGKPLADFVESLVEEGSRRRDGIDLLAEKSFDEILAPFRRNVEESGLSDEALNALFTEARKEASRVRAN